MRTFFRIVLKPLSFLPAIFMMYVIFSFSAQDAETSSQISYKVSHKVIEIGAEVIDADFEEWEVENLASRFHGSIRKIAHMTEYFALAVSVAFPLYVYGLRGFFLVIVAGLFCVAFACGDEYHQSLVAGRNPSKRDVAIDSIGIFAGILLTRIIGWTGRKTIFRPLAKRKKHSADASNAGHADYPPNDFQQNPQSYQNYPPNGFQQNPQSYQNYPPNGFQQNPQSYQNYPPNGFQQNPQSYQNYPPNGFQQNPQSYQNYPPNGFQQNPQMQQNYPPNRYVSDMDNPDSLSEDMSLKRLMHEIKDQKKTIHAEKRAARKPHLEGSEIPEDFVELTEIDLDDK